MSHYRNLSKGALLPLWRGLSELAIGTVETVTKPWATRQEQWIANTPPEPPHERQVKPVALRE
jgi:hypothetical protein